MLLIINITYSFFNLILIVTWLKLKNQKINYVSQKDSKISIIIPCRNEGENILDLLQDLDNQTYPKDNFEVIIANDGSTDDTEKLVLAFQENSNYRIILLNILTENVSSPKKRAIQKSIEIASGTIIISTDGDCRISPDWLSSIENCFGQNNAKLVSSLVTFEDEKTFWNTFQIIEFASLIGSGACAMYLKKPNMCNGANIAYKKDVFFEVGGFTGNEHLASGDDEFLMHKIAKKYPEGVVFNNDKNATVFTKSQPNLAQFYQQRKRWASKWKHYKDWKVIVLAIYIFAVNLGMLYSILKLDFLNIMLKCLPEFFFLYLIVSYLGYKDKVRSIPIVQILYPFYVVIFGLVGQGKGYYWKGRKLS